ncbi:MAG: helix-turn-helix domain-containing protein [Desulfomicrobium sp.]|nr:helix-turn-helix domain-containing protein [Desulfomicrobium sp.]
MFNDSFIDLRQISTLLRVNKTTWRRWCAKGKAPLPSMIVGHHKMLWRKSDIDEIFASLSDRQRKNGSSILGLNHQD